MRKEIDAIILQMEEVLSGSPWYGKSFSVMVNEIDPALVEKKPNSGSHSMIELLYHMVTWAEFTQHRIEKDQHMDAETVEALDWRETNSEIHTWNAGIAQFTAATNRTIELLKTGTDELLDDQVDYRTYSFRHLLNGLIQHNIYHLGQIAYVKKLLAPATS